MYRIILCLRKPDFYTLTHNSISLYIYNNIVPWRQIQNLVCLSVGCIAYIEGLTKHFKYLLNCMKVYQIKYKVTFVSNAFKFPYRHRLVYCSRRLWSDFHRCTSISSVTSFRTCFSPLMAWTHVLFIYFHKLQPTGKQWR